MARCSTRSPRSSRPAAHAHLKVILETGELQTSTTSAGPLIALHAGADFVKTSTGKVPKAGTLPVVLLMLEAVRDHYLQTGQRVGVKAAGGIRTARTRSSTWCWSTRPAATCGWTPDAFRFGASSLLNDVLMQIRKERTGAYQSEDYFTID